MINSKNWRWVIATFVFILMLAIPVNIWINKSNKNLAQQRKSLMSPIIMVPGSSATIDRFNELVDLLNKGTQRKHSLLKIKVSNSGQLTSSGTIRKGDTEPIIVIGFQNNQDGYANILKQTQMLNKAFNVVSQEYKFNNFKAFGHSNGGLIWTAWLEKYYSEYQDKIRMTRLMTLGTPYNFNESNINHKTQMLDDFIKDRAKIPANLYVYTISGGENYESDGIVPENSVAAGKYIYQGRVKHYTMITVTGSAADHSSLPQNQQVIRLIEQYLLQENMRRNSKVKGVRVELNSDNSNN